MELSNYIILIDADKQSFSYKRIITNTDYLNFSKLALLIVNEFNCRSTTNLRLFNFYGIEMTDDSDLSVFSNNKLNDRIIYFTFNNKTSNKVLLNCFSIEKKLGEGGFGRVYAVNQIFSNKKYALKYIKIKRSMNSNYLYKEIDALKKLDHHNIIKLETYFQLESDELALLLEYAEGGTLKSYLSERSRLEEKEAKQIINKLLDTLQYCHKKEIIHRDLKLDNIMYSDSSKMNLKIIDFGIAGLFKKEIINAGTVRYLPPEVLNGTNCASLASIDCWAVGCISYELITGEKLFKGESSKSIKESILNSGVVVCSSITKEALHFINSFIQVSLEKRMSILNAKQHPWILDCKLSNFQMNEFHISELSMKCSLSPIKGLKAKGEKEVLEKENNNSNNCNININSNNNKEKKHSHVYTTNFINSIINSINNNGTSNNNINNINNDLSNKISFQKVLQSNSKLAISKSKNKANPTNNTNQASQVNFSNKINNNKKLISTKTNRDTSNFNILKMNNKLIQEFGKAPSYLLPIGHSKEQKVNFLKIREACSNKKNNLNNNNESFVGVSRKDTHMGSNYNSNTNSGNNICSVNSNVNNNLIRNNSGNIIVNNNISNNANNNNIVTNVNGINASSTFYNNIDYSNITNSIVDVGLNKQQSKRNIISSISNNNIDSNYKNNSKSVIKDNTNNIIDSNHNNTNNSNKNNCDDFLFPKYSKSTEKLKNSNKNSNSNTKCNIEIMKRTSKEKFFSPLRKSTNSQNTLNLNINNNSSNNLKATNINSNKNSNNENSNLKSVIGISGININLIKNKRLSNNKSNKKINLNKLTSFDTELKNIMLSVQKYSKLGKVTNFNHININNDNNNYHEQLSSNRDSKTSTNNLNNNNSIINNLPTTPKITPQTIIHKKPIYNNYYRKPKDLLVRKSTSIIPPLIHRNNLLTENFNSILSKNNNNNNKNDFSTNNEENYYNTNDTNEKNIDKNNNSELLNTYMSITNNNNCNPLIVSPKVKNNGLKNTTEYYESPFINNNISNSIVTDISLRKSTKSNKSLFKGLYCYSNFNNNNNSYFINEDTTTKTSSENLFGTTSKLSSRIKSQFNLDEIVEIKENNDNNININSNNKVQNTYSYIHNNNTSNNPKIELTNSLFMKNLINNNNSNNANNTNNNINTNSNNHQNKVTFNINNISNMPIIKTISKNELIKRIKKNKDYAKSMGTVAIDKYSKYEINK